MLSVLMHWPWALERSHSVSLFKWPFCNQFHDFSQQYLQYLRLTSHGVFYYSNLVVFFFIGLSSLFSYLSGLCYFLSPWWYPCCRYEPFLSILDVVVKPCYCILCTFLWADKLSASFLLFDIQTMGIVFGVMCLMIVNNFARSSISLWYFILRPI